jgi:hypothetical protein
LSLPVASIPAILGQPADCSYAAVIAAPEDAALTDGSWLNSCTL